MDRVRGLVDRRSVGVVWSPNYSIGVNVFRRVVAEAARLLADSTRIRRMGLGSASHGEEGRAFGHVAATDRRDAARWIFCGSIDASSNRAGANPGTHEIGFDSPADTITLRHTARSREGFARGALKAAQWVIGKRGLHEFGEVIFADDAKAARRPAE